MFPPAMCVNNMNRIDQAATIGGCRFAVRRRQEVNPAPLDDPTQMCVRQRVPQRGHGGHGMQNVAHGAESNNENAFGSWWRGWHLSPINRDGHGLVSLRI